MVTSIQNTSVNIKQLLQCSVELDLLRKAVTLVPCCHKINRAVAKRMYGKMMNDVCAIQNIGCPECRTIVKGYYRDYTVRALVEAFFPQIPNRKELPYPGKSASLILSSSHDQTKTYKYRPVERTKEFRFTSATKNSFLKGVQIFEYRNGRVLLKVRIAKTYAELEAKEFFASHDITFEASEFQSHKSAHVFYVKSHNLQKMLRIITENNEISEEYLTLIRSFNF